MGWPDGYAFSARCARENVAGPDFARCSDTRLCLGRTLLARYFVARRFHPVEGHRYYRNPKLTVGEVHHDRQQKVRARIFVRLTVSAT
jgi:hypothetical protein